MRSADSAFSRAMRAASTAFCATISASCRRARLLNLQRAGALVRGDALGGQIQHLRDARLFRRLARGDLGFVDRLLARDLAPARLFLVGDAGVGQHALLRDARLLDRLARRDLRLLDDPHALDLLRAHVALAGDARRVDGALVGDARLLDVLARQDFALLDGARALDVLVPRLQIGSDARLRDRAFVGDARALDRLARGDHRLLGFRLAQRALARHFRALQGAAHFDVALLFEPRRLALALDLQGLPLGFEVARADLDHRVLLDVVAQFAPGLDVLHQPRQTLGVEAVRGVEELQVRLVEIGDGHRFELKAVLRQRLGGRLFDARDIFAALLVHLLHRHLGGDRAQRRDEFAGEQRVQLLRLQRAAAEGRRGDRDGLSGRLHAHVEIGLDVDAHAVARDDGVLLAARDRHRQHVHVDRRVVVDERQHEGAAVDDHAFAEEAGADERHFLRRAMIEPVDDINDDHDDDDRNDEPKDQLADQNPRHDNLPSGAAAQRARIALNLRVCSVSARSTGRRSIEEAP